MSDISTTTNLKSFYYLEDGNIEFSILDTIKSSKTLDAGFYTIHGKREGYSGDVKINLHQQPFSEKIKIHNFADRTTLNEFFTSFFSPAVRSKINEIGFYHKAGILLHGREGTGKSTIVRHYANEAVKNHDAVVIYMPYAYVSECWSTLMSIRKIQPNPLVVVFEEIDVLIGDRFESQLKVFFDGSMSIDNCVVFATTNYIDTIPEALKHRPSRFKYVLHIEGLQDENEISGILQINLGSLISAEECLTITQSLKGKTLDEIKQTCLNKIMEIGGYRVGVEKKVIGFKSK